MVQPALARAFFVAGIGPVPIMEGSTPAVSPRDDARKRRDDRLPASRPLHDDESRGAVVDAARVARCDRAGLIESRAQLGQIFQHDVSRMNSSCETIVRLFCL